MPERSVSADRPLLSPTSDLLGYAPFAELLAAAIADAGTNEGLVIALYGPWGSGKTTVLNFVRSYLFDRPEDFEFVSFNPWWFSGREDLTRRFFSLITKSIRPGRQRYEDLRRRFGEFSAAIGELPLPGATTGRFASKVVTPPLQDVAALKQQISELLQQYERKIVVFVDDVDRLAHDEIMEVFRLVKAVGDFPNVVYVLALDRDVALRAIGRTLDEQAESYLEKIVQVPFDLPPPDRAALRRMLIAGLDAIFSQELQKERFDGSRWTSLYLDGIDFLLRTPRDVTRLLNVLGFTAAPARGEVDAVDFIGVEALRVFRPKVYDIVRRNRDMFAGPAPTGPYSQGGRTERETFHNAWLADEQPEADWLKRYLSQLFPGLQGIWGGSSYGASWEGSWRRNLRVASPDVFDVYFRLSVPAEAISAAEMEGLVDLTVDRKLFATRLQELAQRDREGGTSRLRAYLERLEDYTDEVISESSIPTAVGAIFDVADELQEPKDGTRGVFDWDNDVRFGRLVHQLLRRLPEQARFELLQTVVGNGTALAFALREVGIFGQEQGEGTDQPARPEEEWTVTTEHLHELQQSLVDRIRDTAEAGLLLNVSELPRMLWRWLDWGSELDVRDWVASAIAPDAGLVQLLIAFLNPITSCPTHGRCERG
jgi:predicted KAP-like P-loop ATPase